MLNKYLFRRYLLFAIALFVNAMGIAYITKAALGTSPITSVTYVASMFTPLTMGQWTIVLNRGHLLGEMLAKRLGIRLYDKEFIHLAAQKSGIDEAYIRSNEQSIPSFWLKCILTDGNESSRQQSLSPDDVLFLAESNIIREQAAKEPCIIVGRCADYILQDAPSLIKVFCYSDRESAYQRCTTEYGIPADKARAEIARVNRNRIAHYEYYTGEKWGDPHRYDLMLNTCKQRATWWRSITKKFANTLKNRFSHATSLPYRHQRHPFAHALHLPFLLHASPAVHSCSGRGATVSGATSRME